MLLFLFVYCLYLCHNLLRVAVLASRSLLSFQVLSSICTRKLDMRLLPSIYLAVLLVLIGSSKCQVTFPASANGGSNRGGRIDPASRFINSREFNLAVFKYRWKEAKRNAATKCYRMRRWSNLSTGHPVLVSSSQRLPTSEVLAGVKSKQPGDLLQGYQEEQNTRLPSQTY